METLNLLNLWRKIIFSLDASSYTTPITLQELGQSFFPDEYKTLVQQS